MKRIFGLFKSQTLKDSVIISVGLGITAVIGFIYTVILARTIGPSNFGIYSAITALATIIYSLGDLGIAPALINFIPKNLKDTNKYLTNGFWLQFAVAILIFIFFAIASVLHQIIIPGSITTDLLLAGGLSVNYLFINFAQGIFTAERRFWSYSFSQIIDAVIKIILVFVLFKLNHLSIGSALTANFVSTLFALFITFGRELYQTEFELEKNIVNQIIHFAKWIAVSRVFSVMISKIDVLILNLLAGSFITGIYSAAARVSFFFALLVSGLSSVVTPRYSSFKNHEQVVNYSRKLLLVLFCIIFSMITCSVLADPIIRLVYGEKYLSAIPIFRYLNLAMIPFIFTLITISPLIYTYGQTKFYSYIIAIQVVGMVAIEVLLVPKLGAMAPILALAIMNIFVLTLSAWKLNFLWKST